MTTYYVDSSAGGNNDGSDWTNAWTSLASSLGVAAGSIVLVDDGHSEDPGESVTYNWSNGTTVAPVKIISVDKGAGGYPRSNGATIAQTGAAGRTINILGNVYLDGMTFNASGNFGFGTADKYFKSVGCTFGIINTTARNILFSTATRSLCVFESCTFNINNHAGSQLVPYRNGYNLLNNCTVVTAASHTTVLKGAYSDCNIELRNCAIGAATNIVDQNGYPARFLLRRCSLGAHTNKAANVTSLGYEVIFESCESGNISDTPNTFTGKWSSQGTVLTTTAKYRTGGASDGTNSYAWELTPSATAEEQVNPLVSPPLTRWVAGGSEVTCTLYVAGPAEIYNDEVWMEVEGPDNTASPNTTTRGYWYSSRLAAQGSRAVLTTDSESTWNGSDVNTKRKIVHAFTPQQAGPVVIRACYAKTSGAAIAVDPRIEVA